MDTRLSPITLYKLKAYEERRKRLIALRGLCALLATVLISMTVISFIDFLFVLPQVVRLILSLIAYGLVLAAFYLTSLRWFLRSANLRELAQMFEEGHKELEEEVLSAVELGEPKKKVWDSEELRSLQQKKVASLVRDYHVKAMLPASVIRKWALLAAAVMASCIVLLFVPGLQYTTLMARAFAPAANIGRVSKLQIEIVEPSDPEAIIPRGDPVTIIAQLSEPGRHEVFIESFGEWLEKESATVQMEPIGEQRFAATLVIAGERLSYRVFSGRASTRYFTVASRPRPHVRRFGKTYHYPAYSGLKDKQLVEPAGDVEALEASTVDLKIEVDQPIGKAELWIETEEEKHTTKLNIAGESLLSGQIEFKTSGTYRVHLVAEETQFENKFAPSYEISVLPDLIPSVTIDRPEENPILPSDAIVRLEGLAKDDLGLRTVKQTFRINSGLWQEIELETEPGKEAAIKRDWDLLDMRLKPGDQVLTKLVATDSKGNHGESRVVQITISSPDFTIQKFQDIARLRTILALLERLSETTGRLQEESNQLKEEFHSRPDNTDQHRQTLLNAQVRSDEVELRSHSAWSVLRDALYESDSRRESENAILVGRMLSRLRHDALDRVHGSLRHAGPTWTLAENQLKQIEAATGHLRNLAEQVRRAYQNFLALEEAQSLWEEVKRLCENQGELLSETQSQLQKADDGEKAMITRRLVRRQQAAMREQQFVEQMLDELAVHTEYNQARQARNIQKKIEQQRAELEAVLGKDEPALEELIRRSNTVRDALDETTRGLFHARGTISQKADRSKEDLARSLGETASELSQLKWRLDDLVNQRRKLQELQSKPNIAERQIDEQRTKTTQASQESDHRWASATGQLKDRAQLEDLHTKPSYLFVNDTANTATAVEVLETRAADAPTTKQTASDIDRIHKAYRVLETGRYVDELAEHLGEMASVERWAGVKRNLMPGALEQWDNWENGIKAAPTKLRNAGMPNEIRNILSALLKSDSLKAVGQEARQRQDMNHHPQFVTDQMDEIAVALADVRRQLTPYLEDARKVIAEYIPSLADQLRAAAQQSDQLKKQTEQLTERPHSRQPDDVGQEARGLMREQQALDSRLDSVRDALRRDANIQDLSTQQGQERARDADDAMALLQQPPPQAENLLRQASASSEPQAQEQALDSAFAQQQKLDEALQLVARHYENLEAGNPEPTRTALREAEQQMQLAGQMDGQYSQVDELAQIAGLSPEQLMSRLQQQLQQDQAMQQELGLIADNALQHAISGLRDMVQKEDDIAERLEKIAEKQNQQDRQFSEQNQKLKELNEKAKKLAGKADELAQNEIALASQRARAAGTDAESLFKGAAKAAREAAQQIPKEALATPKQLADGAQQFAGNMDKAESGLHEATEKTRSSANEPSEQVRQAALMAQYAEAQARQLSQEAQQLAKEAKELMAQQRKVDGGFADADAREQRFVQKAKTLAQQAEELADESIPRLSQEAQRIGASANNEFAQAQDAAEKAVEQIPSDFPVSPASLARQVEDFAEMMNQAKQGLEAAAGATDRAANNENRQQVRATGRQVRDAEREALNLGKEATQLAKDLKELAEQRSARLEHTGQQQQQINQAAPQVTEAIVLAAVHAERLGRATWPALQQSAQAMQSISQDELPRAQQALDTARRARQAQSQVDDAYDALASELAKLEELEQQVTAAQALAENAQLMQPSAQASQWMARSMDRLEAAQLAEATRQSAQASALQQAQQAVRRPLQSQQIAMAQARGQQVTAPQAQNATRHMLSAMFSGDKNTADMPPETGRKLPEHVILQRGQWGKLRQLDAQDLMEAQSESVAEEYRAMVNTYFKVVSERARPMR